jgi:aspartyl-tRNA synthetase
VIRTHEAGTLRASDAGQTVTLAGWVATRRDHGGVTFIDLRDASGSAQVVVREADIAHELRNEWVVAVTGEVRERPPGNVNPAIPTGEVEVVASRLDVLNESAPLPFQVDEHSEVGEEARLKYRYLDLRRPAPGAALRLRSKVNRAARETLYDRNFVEIETPTLTRSTPEGARDFLVPARLRPGSWYALPQSPQLFKQLLMVGGMERYFQIARCYRDEDFRADRQPEFTQLDIEMSFVDQDDVIALAEDVLKAVWALIGHEITTPIPRMTYADAMRRYGSDKPDLRLDLELVDSTDYFKDTPFRVFQAPYVGAVVMPGGASQPRKQLDAWQDWARQRGAKGLAYVLIGAEQRVLLGQPRPLGRSRGREAWRRGLLRCRLGQGRAVPARGGAAGDRPSPRPDRRVAVVLRLGRRRAAVRTDERGHCLRRRRGGHRRLDGRASRLHLAQAGVDGHVRHRPGFGPGLRLRHRLQRQRDRRRLDPYPPP